MHILCTICSDLVNQADNTYVTKCGHIFHYHCLSQWIERSKSCPQCRHKVTDRCMFRLYPTISNENTGEDVTTLQSRLDDAQLQLRQQQALFKEQSNKLSNTETELKKTIDLLKGTEKKLDSSNTAVNALKEQLLYLKIQNKETERLKEENENLKKNLQTLNGLQKVLNATSEEVEQMLESYTDVRTVATFAAALKRALCDSESKKNESRDKLQLLKQHLAAEKTNVADLQTKLLQLEDKLINMQRKYESLKKKRKACEKLDKSFFDDSLESAAKIMRTSEGGLNDGMLLDDVETESLPANKIFNENIKINDGNTSFVSMVTNIENGESPYLSLRQSSLALAAVQRRPRHQLRDALLKPSEYAILNSAKSTVMKDANSNKFSIFNKKEPAKLRLSQENDPALNEMNISYDGLGGHSKLETFPVPNNRPVLKNYVPKLTSKHKLKRPNTTGNHDISKMLEKLQEK